MNGRKRGGGNGGSGVLRNPCITMHQPWASLLLQGIKRIEGRSWPAPITGRLWIHAAGKHPEPETIKAMENFYSEIYRLNGITDLKFPEHYPVSRLLGCVDIVGCVTSEELVCWEDVPESVRLEGQTKFCWLCENPQKLVIPFEMRGYQRVYNLENKVFEAAVRGLFPVQGPLPVKFPVPNLQNPSAISKCSRIEGSSSLTAAIAGARAAAMQFSNKDHCRNSVASSANLFQKNGKTEECQEEIKPTHYKENKLSDDDGKGIMENCSSHDEEVGKVVKPSIRTSSKVSESDFGLTTLCFLILPEYTLRLF